LRIEERKKVAGAAGLICAIHFRGDTLQIGVC
jgi:hypothetical protein